MKPPCQERTVSCRPVRLPGSQSYVNWNLKIGRATTTLPPPLRSHTTRAQPADVLQCPEWTVNASPTESKTWDSLSMARADRGVEEMDAARKLRERAFYEDKSRDRNRVGRTVRTGEAREARSSTDGRRPISARVLQDHISDPQHMRLLTSVVLRILTSLRRDMHQGERTGRVVDWVRFTQGRPTVRKPLRRCHSETFSHFCTNDCRRNCRMCQRSSAFGYRYCIESDDPRAEVQVATMM